MTDLVSHNKTPKFALSLRVKLVLAIVSVLLFSVGLNTTLNFLNFEKRLIGTSDSIYQTVVDETHNDISQAISLGLPLSSISNIQSILERRTKLVQGINELSVVDTDGKRLFGSGSHSTTGERLLSVPINNTFGVKVGEIRLYYSTSRLDRVINSLLKIQLIYAASWILVCVAVGFISLKFLLDGLLNKVKSASNHLSDSTQDDDYSAQLNSAHKAITATKSDGKWALFKFRKFPILIIGLVILLTIVANLGSSYQSINTFSNVYQQKLEQKSNLIGDSLSIMIERLLKHGVPVNQLNGLDQEFKHYVLGHDDLVAISLEKNGNNLYDYQDSHADTSNDIGHEIPIGKNTGITLKLITDNNIIIQLLKDSFLDMITVLVASSLVVAEIILFLCHFMILSPWQQLKQSLISVNRDIVNYLVKVTSGDEIGRLLNKINTAVVSLNPNNPVQYIDRRDCRFIRLPLFLLVFAEASSLAFFPNYVASLDNSNSLIPEHLVTSLPISLFMLVWAVSLPFAGYWSDKVGRRFSLIAGALITSFGLFATAMTSSLELLLLTRALTAVGYGIVFISAQGYVTDATNNSNRTKGMATFLSAFFSGSLCGAAIGGIIADKLGYSETFLMASMLALASAGLVAIFFDKSSVNSASKPVKLQDFKILLGNKYFALITFFSAIPAKIVLTGFLYYIVPVYLKYLGESSAASGRIMMGYGLAIIIISPLSAMLVDKFSNKIAFIVFGGLLSALAMLNFTFFSGSFGILLIVILIGIAHGVSVSPQIPLVMELLQDQGVDKGKVIGIFRLTERIGNVAGPLLGGLALGILGYDTTIVVFGFALLLSAFILFIFYSIFYKKDKQRSIEVVS
ncbi:MFS transporter [Vibrio sp. S4M6]|uniref:MFS transporter n=1 Tax=Vibrio sinus TaxID=2946865 RepID=UPI00202A854C|nr:MFS transporter [Vibrio sinus]MCL9783157.1 MFS transporter [Vibrio sinus]